MSLELRNGVGSSVEKMLPPREDSPEAQVCSSPPPPQPVTKEEEIIVVTKSEQEDGENDAIKVVPEEVSEAEDLVKFEVDEKEVEKSEELKAVLEELVEKLDIVREEKVEKCEVEQKKLSTSGGGEGEVVEILSNLASLKTPEPHEVDDGIVRASFVDFVLEEDPIEEEEEDEEEDDEEDIGQMGEMVLNPELQKIREEQVRKWLIFEEENPPKSQSHPEGEENTLSSLTSIDADSVARGEVGEEEGELFQEGEEDDGVQRRVRFLTDTEGNLLISVFMTKLVTLILSILKLASGGYLDYLSIAQPPPSPSPSSSSTSLSSSSITPITSYSSQNVVEEYENYASQQRYSYSSSCGSSADSFILLLEPPDHDDYQYDKPTYQDSQSSAFSLLIHQSPPTTESSMISSNGGGAEMEGNPSLIVSPPSLTGADADKEEREFEVEPKPSAPPQVEVDVEVEHGGDEEEEDDEDDEEPPSIVMVSPSRPAPPTSAPPTQSEEEAEGGNSSDETLSVSSCNSMIEIMPGEKPPVLNLDENNNNEVVAPPQVETKSESETAPHANFHIENKEEPQVPQPTLQNLEEVEEQEEEQPASLIIHDLEEHSEGFASQNGLDSAPLIKLPNIDENNNVVESEKNPEEEQQFKFNPALEPPNPVPIQAVSPIMAMPELRRSSSDYGEDPERFTPPSSTHSPLRRTRNSSDGFGGASEEDDDHSEQMVSLCIQEEHISAVAVTIAKWESMSKAQSTENLSTIPPQGTHTPVAKTCSSPCPAKSVLKPIPKLVQQQPIVVHQALVQNNRENSQNVKNNSQNHHEVPLPLNNPNSPVGTPPVIVGKAAGWNCWANKLAKEQEQQQVKKEAVAGGPDDEIIYAQPNHSAGTTMTSIQNPSAILKAYPKPLSRGEIVNWLKEGEIHRAGINVSYGQSHHNHHPPVVAVQGQNNNSLAPGVVNWFFGLISRQQAERYLHGQPPGTFLVRISTRIWGYTLSYQASTQRTKHFLISAINPAVPATLTAITDTNGSGPAKLPPQTGKQQRMSPFVPQGRYAFIGTNMTPYGTLVSLIRHHSHAPITKLGGEKLLCPCPGGPQIQGLELLFK